ncbi:MAG: YncE family protein, partial [Sphingopyxis sp.]
MKPISLFWAAALLCGAPALAQDAAPDLPYAMTNSVTLPSGDTGWDYVKFEPGTSRLFMARLHDGLTVYDVDRGQAVATIENSVGANGPILLPKYNRGYVAMADGSLLSFDLKTLKVIARTPLASDGGLNSGSLDPATGQLHIITGTRPSEATWFSLDAATGKLLRTTRFPFRKMDDPAADGKGHLYAPARLDGLVLRLDSATLKEQA